MIEQKRNKIISIAINGAVAAVLVGILIMLCFKNEKTAFKLKYFKLNLEVTEEECNTVSFGHMPIG